MFRLLLLTVLLAASLLAQPTSSPSIYVRNAASGSTVIARGSYASINLIGVGLSRGFPDGATINLITSDGAASKLTSADPPNASDLTNTSELWLLIPQDVPLGEAIVRTTVNGVSLATSIQIVAAAPGLFTIGYSSFGPALALNHPATRNALTSAAVPGGIVSLFGTGLGGVSTAEVAIELAGQTVTPLYAGPQGQPGLDQINFVVPQDATLGCYVPVSVRVRGVVSNQTTISINRDPLVCAHPLGLSYLDLKTLDAGGSIRLAQLTFNSALNVIDEQPSIESAVLSFPVSDAAAVAVSSGIQTVTAQAPACSVVTVGGLIARGGFASRVTIPDAGTVMLAGPRGQQLALDRPRFYSGDVPEQSLPFFTGGIWSLTATGGTDINAFKRDFVLPSQLKFTNLSNTTSVPSSGFTLRWDGSGFGPGDTATISLSSLGPPVNYAYCTVPA